MTYDQVKQCLQEFIFNINVPTVGFQCPFSNLTFDLTVPRTLKDQAVIVGGEVREDTYGDFQAEMDLLNQAFCEVMEEGDAKGRVFTFPIPTINITRDFDWDSPSVDAFMRITAKYGIPYFANYINSELSPEDAVSMCCRLRIDTSQLRLRGGGLFGSNPLTGSVGVFTINLPRVGYLSSTVEEFKMRLWRLVQVRKTSLGSNEDVEHQTEQGCTPIPRTALKTVKERTGEYWHNHFSTIGVLGMNGPADFMARTSSPEASSSPSTSSIICRTAGRDSERDGHVYNLEATAEGGVPWPGSTKPLSGHHQAATAPYYTNPSQLPVEFWTTSSAPGTQDELQSCIPAARCSTPISAKASKTSTCASGWSGGPLNASNCPTSRLPRPSASARTTGTSGANISGARIAELRPRSGRASRDTCAPSTISTKARSRSMTAASSRCPAKLERWRRRPPRNEVENVA